MAESYYTVESLRAERSIGFLIKRCGVLMAQIAERAFEAQPVSFMQWIILIRLSECAHDSPTELSLHMGHDMGALTRLVDELVRKGFVVRERSDQDRRAVQIAITPEGRRQAQAGKPLLVGLLNRLVEPYSRTEIDMLISLLQRMLAQMQEFAGGLTPATAATEIPGKPLPGTGQARKGRKPSTGTAEKSPRTSRRSQRGKAAE